MGNVMQTGMLLAIVGSTVCMLIGAIMIAVRVVKLVRMERALKDKIWLACQFQNPDRRSRADP